MYSYSNIDYDSVLLKYRYCNLKINKPGSGGYTWSNIKKEKIREYEVKDWEFKIPNTLGTWKSECLSECKEGERVREGEGVA
jgi:hypothetical protein